jgi:hypothetical protein
LANVLWLITRITDSYEAHCTLQMLVEVPVVSMAMRLCCQAAVHLVQSAGLTDQHLGLRK